MVAFGSSCVAACAVIGWWIWALGTKVGTVTCQVSTLLHFTPILLFRRPNDKYNRSRPWKTVDVGMYLCHGPARSMHCWLPRIGAILGSRGGRPSGLRDLSWPTNGRGHDPGRTATCDPTRFLYRWMGFIRCMDGLFRG